MIDRFAVHHCRCGIRTKRGQLVKGTGTAHRRRGAQRFVAFLREHGLMLERTAETARLLDDARLMDFRNWLKRERGATDETVRRYVQEASRWLPALGTDPAAYETAAIRSIVLDQRPERSRSSVRMTATVLRSFLRFLASRGGCRPVLADAVPPAMRRRLSTVPRYISPETIERIIALCKVATPVGVRDRAIVLLLARLGLRAGDVWRLRLNDVDWRNSRLLLHGKDRRSAAMPLPQDVGDALTAYIEQARPVVGDDHVFLRSQAPFTPLRSSTEIAGIVARVLKRGGFTGLPTGSHVFRHSLATGLLRAGSNLEAIGVVLRHRSPETTAIYAKVDVAMLEQVAQPWPGDMSC